MTWKAQGFDKTMVKGIDISKWQHPVTIKHPKGKPISFSTIKDTYGLRFVFIKASDGGNRDKGKSKYWFRVDKASATKQGLIVGAYHYAVPGAYRPGNMTLASNRAADARAQAAMAVAHAQGNPYGDLPITLDFEERPCGWTWKETAVWTRDFLLEAERISGRKPMIYANGYFINKLVGVTVPGIDWTDYKLWVAMWGPKYGLAPKPVPIWDTAWTFWQFSSDGAVKGVPVQRTDLDVFNGTYGDLVQLTRS